MKISIITATFNSSATIKSCISSVNEQTHLDIEHLIIDGGSSDDTINKIKSIPNRVEKIISEPDEGIYDAMNKGIKLATGDIIGILNSDDLYIDNNVLSLIAGKFEDTECCIVFGDLFYVNRENPDIIVRKWATKKFELNSFRKGWHPPHPTFFVKKEIYDKYGVFDLKSKLAADFEIMLRFLEKFQIQCTYIPKPLVRMRLGGATNKNLKNIIKQNLECYNAFKRNGLSVSIFYPVFRLIPKLLQFIKK